MRNRRSLASAIVGGIAIACVVSPAPAEQMAVMASFDLLPQGNPPNLQPIHLNGSGIAEIAPDGSFQFPAGMLLLDGPLGFRPGSFAGDFCQGSTIDVVSGAGTFGAGLGEGGAFGGSMALDGSLNVLLGGCPVAPLSLAVFGTGGEYSATAPVECGAPGTSLTAIGHPWTLVSDTRFPNGSGSATFTSPATLAVELFGSPFQSQISELRLGLTFLAACADGIDNDGDGKTDFGQPGVGDPECASLADSSEGADCADGIDNDHDGKIDFGNPATRDAGCRDASRTSVEDPACANGADDDGDGTLDFGPNGDPQCFAPWASSEGSVAPTLALTSLSNLTICAHQESSSEPIGTAPYTMTPPQCHGGLDYAGTAVVVAPSWQALAPDQIEVRVRAGVAANVAPGDYEYVQGILDVTAGFAVEAAANQPWTLDLDGVARGMVATDDTDGAAWAELSGAIAPFTVSLGGHGFSFGAAGFGYAIGTGDPFGPIIAVGFEGARSAPSAISGIGPATLAFEFQSRLDAVSATRQGAVLFGIDDALRVPASTAADYQHWGRPVEPDGYRETLTVHAGTPACRNGIDDDGDGAVDALDPQCASPDDITETPDCSDGIDNDLDGAVDFPADIACTSADDLVEAPPCADGIDNDGDGKADFGSDAYSDPGCSSAADPTERDASFECDDAQDNDGDGLVDLADPDCVAFSDGKESPGSGCNDGVDNDGDGLVDFPADPGCHFATSDFENPACDDDLDNDGDGKIDWDGGPGMVTPDPECTVAYRNRETPSRSGGCGIGAELVLLLPLFGWAQRRRTLV